MDSTKTSGTAVAATGAGQWIRFGDVAPVPGAGRITARVSTPGDAPAAIEVRLGHPRTGRLLGTIPVPATSDRYAWATVNAALARWTGRADLYLVFTAPATLDQVTLSH